MKRRTFVRKSIASGAALIVGHGLVENSAFAENVKIAPSKGKPGHRFTVHDVPMGRLVDGSIARFEAPEDHTYYYDIPLRTHHPYKTANGSLPEYIAPGMYTVWVVGSEFDPFSVGSFQVLDSNVVAEPTIFPTSGGPGDPFRITDPSARIRLGDIALFYALGQDPAEGTVADDISVPYPTSLTGKVPNGLAPVTYHVAVRPYPEAPSRFEGLPFVVD
jgi:hypothetical protein